MEISLVTPGRLKKRYIREGCDDFLTRLGHYARVQEVEVRAESCGRGTKPALVKQREGRRIAEKLPDHAVVIVFDERGRMLDSRDLANLLQQFRDRGRRRIACVIGGPLGLDPRLIERADVCLSLSRLTFPHELARLIVLEQLYRAFSILHGQPYHND